MSLAFVSEYSAPESFTEVWQKDVKTDMHTPPKKPSASRSSSLTIPVNLTLDSSVRFVYKARREKSALYERDLNIGAGSACTFSVITEKPGRRLRRCSRRIPGSFDELREVFPTGVLNDGL